MANTQGLQENYQVNKINEFKHAKQTIGRKRPVVSYFTEHHKVQKAIELTP